MKRVQVKEFKHLIKLILYENDVKLLKFKRSPAQVDLSISVRNNENNR